MGKWTGTIIGSGIGWALFGPLGAIFGAYIGSMVTGNSHGREYSEADFKRKASPYGDTRAGDFAVAMLSLFAYVSKSDKTVQSSEIQYVKKFLIEKFGARNAQDLLYLYKEILKKDYDIQEVSRQIAQHMDYYSRLELVHVLFGIAGADNIFQEPELRAIQEICSGLGISSKDYESIKSIFIKSSNQAYAILNVAPNDDIDVVKKAYRDLAVKYHPDKVSQLGPEIQKLAEEKFKSINDAYQTIRKERGF
ncbi:MAG TPA: molecular chaperone DjlA [Candidatus Marinimicrobia bacterium]|nr:molecular chaperone DjlA [Candidatus Neomarinimicrobiota bacterium]